MTKDANKTMLWVLLGTVALAAIVSLIGGAAGWGTWGWGGMMGLMGIWMLVPLVFFVWLITAITNQNQGPRIEQDALAIAERRLAAGEIDQEEFERIHDTLRRSHR